jgi:hypothetical protein
MAPGLAEFLDRGDPPIVFTLGSAASGAPGAFYDESVKAAALLGRRAVFLVSKYAPALSQSELPAGMMVVELTPHDALFPRAAATVHHGGIGPPDKLRSGRPMLVMPHARPAGQAARSARLASRASRRAESPPIAQQPTSAHFDDPSCARARMKSDVSSGGRRCQGRVRRNRRCWRQSRIKNITMKPCGSEARMKRD